MKNTAELARAAIAFSAKHCISRRNALFQILYGEPLNQPPWMTREEALVRMDVRFACVLSLISELEPNKINANFKGVPPRTKARLRRLMADSKKNGEPNLSRLLRSALSKRRKKRSHR